MATSKRPICRQTGAGISILGVGTIDATGTADESDDIPGRGLSEGTFGGESRRSCALRHDTLGGALREPGAARQGRARRRAAAPPTPRAPPPPPAAPAPSGRPRRGLRAGERSGPTTASQRRRTPRPEGLRGPHRHPQRQRGCARDPRGEGSAASSQRGCRAAFSARNAAPGSPNTRAAEGSGTTFGAVWGGG
ncbi:hypothetical protein EMIHUDRAFT_456031 [Emiliania huxleyi CCMP1516]|uniref:Uncharacterized protein n=2 Tax=Emiliania huxleyi TaxID=2903 RepID=A0A0D3KA79_EMIH1|nr:hypothetical protein EMIHUDRAFT_456031 [Emiliania huxleyi CCMP1516]EOD32664.1 hypothetical protein EMIHUDRAFT_456031 [Emiliania huxleyi CCMP1516]|eukprot:XP_005785093.1 hypothetical protein EMIHUDRAFT_456031 [Emiliania huxleyi CCMP1516]